jgi:hypothetical protein
VLEQPNVLEGLLRRRLSSQGFVFGKRAELTKPVGRRSSMEDDSPPSTLCDGPDGVVPDSAMCSNSGEVARS